MTAYKGTMRRIARTKYHNQPTEYNGRRYASKAEARRAQELDLLKAAGEVDRWLPQVKFALSGFRGSLICNHIVDFWVRYADGREEVEDVKGMETPVWKLKYKLFIDMYPDMPYRVIGKRRRR